MIKTYITGVLLGIVATIAAVFFVPVVDQHRESSIIAVAPNGGNTETFHINIPMDRIISGAQGLEQGVPADLVWPDEPLLAGVQAEMFKVRNVHDSVIGIASRVAGGSEALGDTIEWVLHFPARGSVFVSMRPDVVDGVYRVGDLSAGTREFADLTGRLSERWVPVASDDEDNIAGRIELVSTYVSTVVPDDPYQASAGEAELQ